MYTYIHTYAYAHTYMYMYTYIHRLYMYLETRARINPGSPVRSGAAETPRIALLSEFWARRPQRK